MVWLNPVHQTITKPSPNHQTITKPSPNHHQTIPSLSKWTKATLKIFSNFGCPPLSFLTSYWEASCEPLQSPCKHLCEGGWICLEHLLNANGAASTFNAMHCWHSCVYARMQASCWVGYFPCRPLQCPCKHLCE